MGFTHIHGAHKKHVKGVQVVEKRDGCSNGLYQAPQLGVTVDSLQPLPITWDPSCLDAKTIDIYLYSPGSEQSRIHVWQGVDISRGTYNADLMPRWWGNVSPEPLQLIIVPTGDYPFMAKYPNGPVFNATYTEPESGVPAAADTSIIDPTGVTPVNDLATKPSSMTPGKAAAAVILPLLFVILCIGAYIKMKRSRNKDKRKAWTEKVDRRMSTISADWKSVSAAGANAAIRNSIAVGARNSSFSFGAIRHSSTFNVEGGDVEKNGANNAARTIGVGLRNPAALSSTERVSRVSFAPETRVSRVSFADSRPSGESRRTRAFHSAYIPPVPALPDHNEKDITAASTESDENGPANFSPRQTQGALTLTPEDIRTRIAANKKAAGTVVHEQHSQDEKSGFSEFLPALSMMRTGGEDSNDQDDFLFPTPVSPPPAYPKSIITNSAFTPQPTVMNSPVMSTMPMQPMPASVMSPDEMLRAYAERKKSMGGKIGGAAISYPVPAASISTPTATTTNIRVLYETNTTGSSNGGYINNPFGVAAASVIGAAPPLVTDAQSEYSTTSSAEAYVAHTGYALGHHANESIGIGAYGGAKYSIGGDEDDDVPVGRAA